jgi:ankyrin repeat protein/energy-coupling factor transporter ATP-binding protein EcfA2
LQKQHDSTLQQSSKDEELLRSVKGGLTPRVRHLLQTGADIDCQDDAGLSALHIAVATGFEDVVDLLLQIGADINALHPVAGTPLCLAASKERLHIIRKLIAARADINRAPEQGATPLHWASFYGDIELLTSLLRSGAQPLAIVDVRCMDGETPATTRTCPRNYARSPLGLAAERGHVECTRKLCQHVLDGSETFLHGLGPLIYACLNGNLECVDLLLQHGVDPNERVSLDDDRVDSQSSTYTYAILLTMQKAQRPILRSLVNAEARTDVRAGDGTSITRILLSHYPFHRKTLPLQLAGPLEGSFYNAFASKVNRVLELASATPLSISLRRDLAVFETHVVLTVASTSANSLNELLDLGADINVTDRTGSTALHLAVTVGDPMAIERLLRRGARTEVYYNARRGPLWEAVDRRDFAAVKLLLSHGANPNVRNSDGQTLLHLVARRCHKEMVSMLVEAGASVSVYDDQSRTPLYFSNDESMARVLIELGADPFTSRLHATPDRTYYKTRHGVARIMVLGQLGSGKSTFINALTGRILPTSSVSPRSKYVTVVRSYLLDLDAEIDVIDTPSSDDTDRSPSEILQEVRDFLMKEYEAERKLHCIVYLIDLGSVKDHAISTSLRLLRRMLGLDLFRMNFVFTRGVPAWKASESAHFREKVEEESLMMEWWNTGYLSQALHAGASSWQFTLSGEKAADDLEKKLREWSKCVQHMISADVECHSPGKDLPQLAELSRCPDASLKPLPKSDFHVLV